jgi:phosphate transport system ATP-binding protein
MQELKTRYTIAIVTHNLQQAKRVADTTAFLYIDTSNGGRTGYMVEYGSTQQLFEQPKEQYTKEYVSGQFG